MRLHPLYVSRLLNRPQMITPAAGAAVVSALMPGFRLDGYDGPSDATQRNSNRDYVVASTTAVIPIIGELVHRGGEMDALSGVTSYEALQDMCVDALSDPTVSGILLDIDSPGGEAGGNLDFAEWLASQRGTKPIVAFVNWQACSGAYAIASAADTICIAEDAICGSIGVVTYHVDASQALAKEGVVVTYIYAGDRKIDGNPTQPLSPEAKDETNSIVQTIYARFCDVVAANRGLPAAAVRGTQAGVFTSQDAINAGLADQIATYGEALMAAQPRTAPTGARQTLLAFTAAGPLMSGAGEEKPGDQKPVPAATPGEPGADPVDKPVDTPQKNTPHSPGQGPADAGEIANMCTAAGHSDLIAGFIAAKASANDVTVRLGQAKEIQAIAHTLGLPRMASHVLRLGLSVEDARKELFAMKADKEAGSRTDPVVHPEQAAGNTVPAINAAAIYSRNNAPRRGRRAA